MKPSEIFGIIVFYVSVLIFPALAYCVLWLPAFWFFVEDIPIFFLDFLCISFIVSFCYLSLFCIAIETYVNITGRYINGFVSTQATIYKLEWWSSLTLTSFSAVIGAGAGATIIFYYHLNTIIGIVAGIIIAYALMYFILKIYKRYGIDKKEKEESVDAEPTIDFEKYGIEMVR